MHVHKMKMTTAEDRRVEFRLPEDFPLGPVEVIVLAAKGGNQVAADSPGLEQNRALAVLAELRTVPLTREEEEVLDQFEAFRRKHPIQFSSLADEDDDTEVYGPEMREKVVRYRSLAAIPREKRTTAETRELRDLALEIGARPLPGSCESDLVRELKRLIEKHNL